MSRWMNIQGKEMVQNVKIMKPVVLERNEVYQYVVFPVAFEFNKDALKSAMKQYLIDFTVRVNTDGTDLDANGDKKDIYCKVWDVHCDNPHGFAGIYVYWPYALWGAGFAWVSRSLVNSWNAPKHWKISMLNFLTISVFLFFCFLEFD